MCDGIKPSFRRLNHRLCYTVLLHNPVHDDASKPCKSSTYRRSNFYTKHLHNLPRGMVSKGNVLHIRKRVPAGLKTVIGKSEMWRSLKTGDVKIAVRRCHHIHAEIEAIFDQARLIAGLTVGQTMSSPSSNMVLADHLQSKLNKDSVESHSHLCFAKAYDRFITDPTHAWSRRTRATQEELIDKSPSRGMRILDKTRRHDKRRPFAPQQLQAIFNAPLYSGCVDDQTGCNKIGSERPKGTRFWIPLLGLFTGMRLNEIFDP